MLQTPEDLRAYSRYIDQEAEWPPSAHVMDGHHTPIPNFLDLRKVPKAAF